MMKITRITIIRPFLFISVTHNSLEASTKLSVLGQRARATETGPTDPDRLLVPLPPYVIVIALDEQPHVPDQ